MGESAAAVRAADSGTGWEHRGGLAAVDFPRTGWGHRGYDEAAVDTYVRQATEEIAAADEQIQDLRLEVDRLHRYIRRQWAAVAAAESAHADGDLSRVSSPAAQARAVLTQAQEIAERRLTDAADRLREADELAADRLARADLQVATRLAETDEVIMRRIRDADDVAGMRLSRADAIAEQALSDVRRESVQRRANAYQDAQRLLAMARTRYEGIVIRAHQRADQAAEVALHSFEAAAADTGDAGRARAELEMKAAYLRTFAKVSRTALQAALDLSGREFDRLLGAAAGPVPPLPDQPERDSEATEAAAAKAARPPGHPGLAAPAEIGRPRSAVSQVITLPKTGEIPGLARVGP